VASSVSAIDPRAGATLERLGRWLDNRTVLSVLFMLPAALLLLLFLTYPLILGVWMGFTDVKIGRPGVFIGLENYISLFNDGVFLLSVFNTIVYTVVATVLKFGLGLWLALLLNHHIPLKAYVRAFVLLPYIIPTVLSAIAFWWIYDAQFSIISWALTQMGLIDVYIDFLGQPWNARWSVIAANVWRGIPFVAICLLAGLQTISPSLYEAAALDGANSWQRFWHVTVPMLMPILAVVLTFSVLFTFTDFQLIYAITRGGPMIPFLVGATVFSYYGLQRRKWQQGSADD
jgi:multiple sugar transport system permease protein